MGFNGKNFTFIICALLGLLIFTLAGQATAKESAAFSKGRQFYKNQVYNKALQELQRAVQENPGESQSHYYLGLTYGKLKQHKRAVSSLEKAISLNPKLTTAYLSLGINQYKLKSYNAALKSFNRAIKANPNDGAAYFFKGLAYQGKEEYQKAIPAFRKSKSLSADYSQLSLFNIGLANFKLKNDNRAGKYFQQTINADPKADISDSARKFQKIIAYRNKKEKPWRVEASAGFEYNDNVISAEQDLVSGGDDIAAIIEFEGGLKILDFGNIEVEASYDFFQRLYQEDLTAFDFQSHSPAISVSGDFDNFTAELDYRYTWTSLGEVDFMQINTLTPSVGIAWTPTLYTYLSYMYMDKEFQEAVNAGRNADNNSIGFSQFIFFMKSKAYLMGGYRWTSEDASDDMFDYDGHAFSLGAKLPGPFKTTLRLNYKYTARDYTKVTTSIGVLREDDKQTFKAEISRDFIKHLRLKAKYEYIDNDSNLPSVVYTENILYLGLSVFF